MSSGQNKEVRIEVIDEKEGTWGKVYVGTCRSPSSNLIYLGAYYLADA